MLQDEATRRDTQAASLRAQKAQLDPAHQLENWDVTAKVSFDRELLNELASLRFVESNRHVAIVGHVGVGKTFLSHALGHVACRRGHSVLAVQADRPEMGMVASAVSRSPAVRARLLTLQRQLGSRGGVVVDGRDIGTVVFPDADVKFYLDSATPEERGRRRHGELRVKQLDVDLAAITEQIRVRDRQDSSREIAPLRRAGDAVLIDSSVMTIDEVVDARLVRVKERVR